MWDGLQFLLNKCKVTAHLNGVGSSNPWRRPRDHCGIKEDGCFFFKPFSHVYKGCSTVIHLELPSAKPQQNYSLWRRLRHASISWNIFAACISLMITTDSSNNIVFFLISPSIIIWTVSAISLWIFISRMLYILLQTTEECRRLKYVKNKISWLFLFSLINFTNSSFYDINMSTHGLRITELGVQMSLESSILRLLSCPVSLKIIGP